VNSGMCPGLAGKSFNEFQHFEILGRSVSCFLAENAESRSASRRNIGGRSYTKRRKIEWWLLRCEAEMWWRRLSGGRGRVVMTTSAGFRAAGLWWLVP
jgi:hypothetical protein